MNYQKIYTNLIESRKALIYDESNYTEKHHIIPKCMGGTDAVENMIRLSYREHFLAHLLLTKIYPYHKGVNYALLCMLRKNTAGRTITSKVYETIKKNYSKYKKFYCNIQNPGKTENSRNSARERMLNRNPIKLDPSKNRTAQKIMVIYEDGTEVEFSYAKELSIKNGVPYGTVKHMLKNNVGCKKWNIKSITRIKK